MTYNARMYYSGILIHLTEQVLAIDQLQWASTKATESQAQPFKMLALMLCHVPNYLGLDTISSGSKTLAYTVARTRTRYHKFHLVEVKHGRIVQIDGKLISQE